MYGKVVIDKDGTSKTVTLLADQLRINTNKSSGTDNILAGQTEVSVENSFVEETSIILITPNIPLPQTLAATDKIKGVSFKAKLSKEELQDIEFSYLIIGQGEKT